MGYDNPGDTKSPVLLENIMIDTKIILNLVSEKIDGTPLFLVEAKVDSRNNISVFVDSPQGVSIDECVAISRHVENALDRDSEDFTLEVSSPGIGDPFRVLKQYQKSIGRTVDVLYKSGKKIQGELMAVTQDEIIVKYSAKEKPEGAKRPKMVEKETQIKFDEIKTTKEIITF